MFYARRDSGRATHRTYPAVKVQLIPVRHLSARQPQYIAHMFETATPPAFCAGGIPLPAKAGSPLPSTLMARNPVPLLVPCHRAIRNDFIPRSYGCGGPARKTAILTWE